MARKNEDRQRALLDVVAKYWQGYASVEEAESPILREWSGQTLARKMVERAVLLCDTYIAIEGERRAASGECSVAGSTVYVPTARDWNGIKLSVFGLDFDGKSLPAEYQSRVRDAAQDSLPLCILPSSYIEDWQSIASEIREQGRMALPLFPVDVNALARGRSSLLDLIEFKLFRLILLDKPDVETQYGDLVFEGFAKEVAKYKAALFTDLEKTVERIGDQPANWAVHPMLEKLGNSIRSGRDCLLVGPSSSGKSTLAFQIGLRLITEGTPVYFVDVGSVSPYGAAGALRQLRNLCSSGRDILLIIDDLQTNPSVARHLLTVKRLLGQAGSSGKIVVLGVTWPSYAEEAGKELGVTKHTTVNPQDARRALLSRYGETRSAEDIAALGEIAADDVLLWRLLLESPQWKKPSRGALAKQVWTRRTQNYRGDLGALRRAVMFSALLGRYEFEMSDGFLESQAGVSRSVIVAMVKARVLRRTMKNLVLGHRSVCSLLADWLARDPDIWADLRRLGKPAQPTEIVNAYIRMADSSQVWAIMKKLHMQVGFRGSAEISQRAQVLVDAWKSIDSLIERVEHQQSVDPTWGGNIASALFAIEALCAVGKRDKARASVEFIRSHWGLVDGKMELYPGTVERLDFDLIRKRMEEEDEILSMGEVPRDPAGDVDAAKMHAIWTKGLILCAEGAYRERSDQELGDMAIAVEREQEPDGCFYPRRVPWVTARVLMGLTRCGRSHENSLAVRNTCDWLLRPYPLGGSYQQGVWESGTGRWNTPLETTCMCVIALVWAGIPPTDPRITASWRYIVSGRAEWTKPQREIDGANAIRAHLAVVGNWKDIVPEVQFLLRWARGEAVWGSATQNAQDVLGQSCRVAIVADYLVEAAWSNLRNELPSFLETFAVTSPTAEERIPEMEGMAGASYIERLRYQYSIKISAEFGTVVGSLRSQMEELKSYEEMLQHGQSASLDFDELAARRRRLEERISNIGSSHDSMVARLESATTETEVKDIYRDWQGVVRD